ncbi:hypothetical protein WJX74_005544 [Apatococcus lobatus]|uniref:Uncharacterized protein n=1 Tax=Apatococcus lobatus TaxID=904363 RepID=A0AAW1Q1G6_9CHLO
MDRETRRIANSQRDRCYRKHHGWVRAKRCGFCERLSHVDEMGVLAPPWRVRRRRGEAAPVHSCLTWYCCTQCAQHLDVTQSGWHRRAPRVLTYDATVPDYDPDWTHIPAARPQPRHSAKPEPEPKPEPETGSSSSSSSSRGPDSPPVKMAVLSQETVFGAAGRADLCWADEVEEDGDVKFGSF